MKDPCSVWGTEGPQAGRNPARKDGPGSSHELSLRDDGLVHVFGGLTDEHRSVTLSLAAASLQGDGDWVACFREPISTCPGEIPLPDGWALLLVEVEGSRGGLERRLGQIRREYRMAAGLLGLGDQEIPDGEDLVRARRGLSGLGFHAMVQVYQENARARAAARALREGDLVAFGELLLSSHASARDDMGLSPPSTEVLVRAMQRLIGREGGARLLLGSIGVCVIGVSRAERASQIVRRCLESARERGPGSRIRGRVLLRKVPEIRAGRAAS